jgi:hypothetical protein
MPFNPPNETFRNDEKPRKIEEASDVFLRLAVGSETSSVAAPDIPRRLTMPNVTDSPAGSEAESTTAYLSTSSKKLHPAVDRALDFYLNPAVPGLATGHTPSTIFVVAPDVDNETLLAHACESLASASVMASEFAGMLEGASRNAMLALQQVIMLSELAVNRVLDNVGPPHRA